MLVPMRLHLAPFWRSLLLVAVTVLSVVSGTFCDDNGSSEGICREGHSAATEHLMLQKKLSWSRSSEEGDMALADCHTAVSGEPCFTAVAWAKDVGIKIHANWYAPLNESSSFEDFQMLLHKGGHGADHQGAPNFAGCRKPCSASPAPSPAPSPASGNSMCHTAIVGERCYTDVKWAKDFGIRLHPTWYPHLTEASTFEDIQELLHRKGHHSCPLPCQSSEPLLTAPQACQALVLGEACYVAVHWARDFGVNLHPEWYPDLTAASSLSAFQALLHERGQGSCGKPCPSDSEPPSPAPAPTPPALEPIANKVTRFMTWNVYYLNLGSEGRVHGIAEGIAQVAPEIASIQEMWSEKPQILDRLIQITGQDWKFAPGGETETVWDGDILYRSDIWRHKDSGLRKYGDRGLSWAVLERISDGVGVLVYGTHPWYTYPNDRPILETMKMATDDMKARQAQHPYPVVFMGDMNAHYELESQRLLRSGSSAAYGLDWCAALTFMDSYAEMHPEAPNPPSGNWPVKIDFVYFEKSPNRMGKVVDAQVWPGLPGGSDHFAVTGDIILQPVSADSVQNARFMC